MFNALNAFALNLAVFLLVKRTSALTMNVCGLIKDWFTIGGSVFFFGSVVTVTNLVGYGIAFSGRSPGIQRKAGPLIQGG